MSVDKESYTLTCLFHSLNYMDIDIKGMGVLTHMGVLSLSHLTLKETNPPSMLMLLYIRPLKAP